MADAEAALTRLRDKSKEAPAAETPPVATETAPPNKEKQSVDDSSAEVDTDAEVPDDETDVDLDEDTAPDEEASGPVAFHLDDGTPVSAEEAKKGYLRREDYSQKTAAVAEVKGLVDTRLGIVDKTAEFLAARLPFVLKQMEAAIPVEPDPALRQTDAAAYWDQYNLRRARLGELQQLTSEFEAYDGARQQEQELSRRQKFVEESGKLLEALPTWKNPKVAAKERQKIVAYGRKSGYSDAELSTVDHRGILVLRDAMLGARVRAAGGKKVIVSNPTIPTNKTTGIGANPKANGPSQSNVGKSTPVVDPNASNRDRFQQGVALLAARRPH
jgi:uncharacterized protein YkwD